ncbi:MAG TPA: hypothetical protein V6C91_20245 [Coleofasciculaceae cyanobacterium]
MNVLTNHSVNQNSISQLHTPEIFKETDAQTLSQVLLEELHQALCWQRQTLAEAAVQIQELLKQLEATDPTATAAEQKAFVTAAISPMCKERFLSALQAGWKDAIKEFLDKPYLNVGIAMLEEWKVAD